MSEYKFRPAVGYGYNGTVQLVSFKAQLERTLGDMTSDFYTKEEIDAKCSKMQTNIDALNNASSLVIPKTAEDVAAAPAGSDIMLESAEAIEAMTSAKEFKNITIIGGNTNKDIKTTATDSVVIDGMTVNGDKGASNGRVIISSPEVSLKDITVEYGSTAYNIFEGYQSNQSKYYTKEYNIDGIHVDNILLNHNVVNIYTFQNDAVVNFKNSDFNLDVDNSNALRLANYANASGVTINFENVNWTYENAEASDWDWAGLVIFQPSATDKALNGDYSAIKTWKFNFKNCKYNGVPVTANNFGEHNQVMYMYNLNKSGKVSDPAEIEGLTITFE